MHMYIHMHRLAWIVQVSSLRPLLMSVIKCQVLRVYPLQTAVYWLPTIPYKWPTVPDTVRVCLCYIHTYIHTHTHMHTYLNTIKWRKFRIIGYACKSHDTSLCRDTHIHTYTHTHIHTHIYTHIHTHAGGTLTLRGLHFGGSSARIFIGAHTLYEKVVNI